MFLERIAEFDGLELRGVPKIQRGIAAPEISPKGLGTFEKEESRRCMKGL